MLICCARAKVVRVGLTSDRHRKANCSGSLTYCGRICCDVVTRVECQSVKDLIHVVPWDVRFM